MINPPPRPFFFNSSKLIDQSLLSLRQSKICVPYDLASYLLFLSKW